MNRKFIKWRWNLMLLAGHDAVANKLLNAFHFDEEGPQK